MPSSVPDLKTVKSNVKSRVEDALQETGGLPGRALPEDNTF
jgi:hypothetical protein